MSTLAIIRNAAIGSAVGAGTVGSIHAVYSTKTGETSNRAANVGAGLGVVASTATVATGLSGVMFGTTNMDLARGAALAVPVFGALAAAHFLGLTD